MTTRSLSETEPKWFLEEMKDVIPLLAQGYSQSAIARMIPTVSQQNISYWLNGAQFASEFRQMVRDAAELFQDNLEAVEDQDTVLATAIMHRALSGELQRDGDRNPLQYDAAVELLRATRWKIKAQGGHKQFGS